VPDLVINRETAKALGLTIPPSCRRTARVPCLRNEPLASVQMAGAMQGVATTTNAAPQRYAHLVRTISSTLDQTREVLKQWSSMHFTIVGRISSAETIAAGKAVRIRRHLIRRFGAGRWRKMKGEATIRFADGTLQRAELHWFEAHGIGRVYFKRKRNLEWRS